MLRAFVNLVTGDLSASRAFYEAVGFTPRFVSDWFVQLGHPAHPTIELGLLSRTSEVVPNEIRAAPAGVMLTVVVADVDALLATLDAEVVEAPVDLFYGQRRAVVRAPEGTLVDLSCAIDADPDWRRRVVTTAEGYYEER